MRVHLVCASVLLLSACGGAAFSDGDDADAPHAASPLQPSHAASDPMTPPAPAAPDTASPQPTPPADAIPDEPAPAFAGSSGAVLGADPSGFACTEVGCLSGFSLNFEKETPWREGSYVFRVLGSNGLTHACDVQLTSDDMLLGSRCDGFFMTRDAGNSVPASAQVQLVAEQIEFEVLFEGERIAFAKYTPVWKTNRPNGPECEPVCINGNGQTLSID
jgi:hypothetical protein